MVVNEGLPQIVSQAAAPEGVAASGNEKGISVPGPPGGGKIKLVSATVAPGVLGAYFDALHAAHGAQHWWPGRTRFEIVVGAILTQNTSWRNVEAAIGNLRKARLLSPLAIRRARFATIASALRPAGYFRQKTRTLKGFVDFLFAKYRGTLALMLSVPAQALREQLLGLRGIGPETADSILLYAGRRPVFVVDAYSRRILERHSIVHGKTTYGEIQQLFENDLPRDHLVFNEFHALIVETGKLHCRAQNPLCSECPLARFLPQSTLTGT